MILRAAVAFLAFVSLQANAWANPYIRTPGGTQAHDFSAAPMVGISGHHGIEIGAKGDFLLVNPGFIPMLNNSVYLEGSVFLAARHGFFVAPALRWDFHIHPQWTVYGAGGIEANLNGEEHDDDASILFAAGALWRIPGKGFLLRGEVDAAHGAARVGPVFPF